MPKEARPSVWVLDTYTFAAAVGRDLYHNGTRVATDDNALPLLSNTGSTLGHFRALPGFWFQGDLAEIVIYDRVLTAEERLRVEAAVAGRYGLPLRLDGYAPCASGWSRHGHYVSVIAHTIAVFVAAGVFTAADGAKGQAAAATSSCGSRS